jgi:LmbE family N-acetylglucosaminyl deacetylase
MAEIFKLLCVLAHPDDESLGLGSTLAKYGAEGVETYLVMATRGERGEQTAPRPPKNAPDLQTVSKTRSTELHAAARVLGIHQVTFLDYVDGELDHAVPAEVVGRIVSQLRRIRPQVVITFGPDGTYGHPDHVAISQLTTAAVVSSADPAYYDPLGLASHRVSKLYYLTTDNELVQVYNAVFGKLAFPVNGISRGWVTWPDWVHSARIDATDYWRLALQAIRCHQSQADIFGELEYLPLEKQRQLWGQRTFYRAFSLVNGGSRTEKDLFEGLRVPDYQV